MITQERRAELREMNDVHAVTPEGMFRINTPEFIELLDAIEKAEEMAAYLASLGPQLTSAEAEIKRLTPHREPLAEGREHLTVSGTFQSDKYPWCPAGFLPLKLTDRTTHAMLLVYAEKRKPVDSEFSRDLHQAVLTAYDKEQAP